ncbi:MAG: aminotransferase class I/II-fold pyridoxal phosphate-dependent enzyme [Oscillospiraceae bacterium]|nr:aminotransferase class I/II-fold pyridoxal phosphate-dependent enzyme [Oscillospiraceae bacterium]
MSRFFDFAPGSLIPYTPGEQPRTPGKLIKLNTNESPYPPSPEVVAAIDREQINDLRLYPDPNCDKLISAVAEHFDLPSDTVFPCNGSDEALALCFHGFCRSGAVFPDVTYGFYRVLADMFRVKSEIVPLRGDLTTAPDDYIGKKGTVFLANPNAPTGIYLNILQIEAVLRQDPDRLLVLDEAYIDFGAQSSYTLLKDFDNLLIVQTFSKSRQLAGGRVGFALGNRELISDLNTMRFCFNPYNINRLSLAAGAAAMRDTAYFDQCREKIMAARERTVERLRGLGMLVTDSLANFVFIRPPGISGFEYCAALRQRGILVRYFDAPRLRDFVRVTIGTDEQMNEFFAATNDILKERGQYA